MTPPVTTVGDAPEGLVELKVKNALGGRIGFFQVDASAIDDELRSDIRRWQVRHAGAALHLIRSSGETAVGLPRLDLQAESERHRTETH